MLKNEVEEVEYVSKKEKHTFSSDFLPNHWLHLFFSPFHREMMQARDKHTFDYKQL